MDPRRFDSLTRSLATPKSRRGLLGSVAALAAGLLGGRATNAQVTQAQCGNVVCYNRSTQTVNVSCAPGCVCCVFGNGNSRCMPPGSCTGTPTCPPGQVLGPSGTCAAPTTTTTTTTTTSAPTTTTSAPATTTTTTAPSTTTTTTTTTSTPTTTTTTAAPVNPSISVVVTPVLSGLFIDVSGTGFSPNGTVNFNVESLGGEDLSANYPTVADSSGAFGPHRLYDGYVSCLSLGYIQQVRVAATDVTTGSSDSEEVNLPCVAP